MNDKRFRIAFVIICLSFIWSLTRVQVLSNRLEKQNLDLSSKIKQIDSLQKYSDSLHMELFPVQIELGRYQVAYEIFMERNPKAASQYGTIISEETE
jgi:hypothetical protein